jgi:EAL domain-containing protein (putative c-di-GMP-specific phosphodiesterase class I)
VNVAAAELADPRFVEHAVEKIRVIGLPAGRIGMEVTEETLDQLGSGAPAVLRELQAGGITLAVDDFGTWYSSLATLGELPINAIKLDRSFVRGVGSDLDDDEIVASVIRLAHARELYVVAEGVESWTEGARLTELGCDRAYGYLFAGPQRADRAAWMLSRGLGWHGVSHPLEPEASDSEDLFKASAIDIS